MTLPFIYLFTVFTVNVLYYVSLNPLFKFLPNPELYSNLLINFVFFGFIMGLQDKLYEQWRGKSLFPRMLVLIILGAIVTLITNIVIYTTNPTTGYVVGVCGFVAFGLARLADLFVYHVFRKRSLTASIFLSKTTSGMLDPIFFLMTSTLYGYHWAAAVPSFPALIAGGIIWSLLLIKGRVLG